MNPLQQKLIDANEKINPDEVYLLEDVKSFLLVLEINLHLIESLYYFDYDVMNNVVRGFCIKTLIVEKLKEVITQE